MENGTRDLLVKSVGTLNIDEIESFLFKLTMHALNMELLVGTGFTCTEMKRDLFEECSCVKKIDTELRKEKKWVNEDLISNSVNTIEFLREIKDGSHPSGVRHLLTWIRQYIEALERLYSLEACAYEKTVDSFLSKLSGPLRKKYKKMIDETTEHILSEDEEDEDDDENEDEDEGDE